MAEALQHLHARGIAHLDVKPDNIYTTPDGAYKLGDFGLACPRGGVTLTLSPEEGDSRCASCTICQVFCARPTACTYRKAALGCNVLYILSLQMHEPR